jgi:predicted SprT family Zn-dependent metalloprotease
MVLDLTKFTQYQPPQPEFLMVLEELPGITHYEDLTAILSVRTAGRFFYSTKFCETDTLYIVFAITTFEHEYITLCVHCFPAYLYIFFL